MREGAKNEKGERKEWRKNGENEKRSRQADRFRDVIIKRASEEEEEEEEGNQIVKRKTTDNGNGRHCRGK